MTDREPENVDPIVLTCEQVDEADLDAAYLAGRLAEPEAEAFEAHVFACEVCWPRLEVAIDVAGARPRIGAGVRPRQWYRMPLAAAAIGLMVAGGWWVSLRKPPVPTEALRGGSDSVAVRPELTDAGVTVQFGATSGADHYRIRVYSKVGDLLIERETQDTTLAIVLEPNARSRVGDGGLAEVTALDPLLEPVASSGLVRLQQPPR